MNRLLIATLTLVCGALLLAPRPVSLVAQTGVQQVPAGSVLPVTVIPASAVNGAGTATVPIGFLDGSAPTPSMTFASTTNLGFYRNNSTSIGFAQGGTATALITSGDIRHLSQTGSFLLGSSSDAGFTRVGVGEVSTPAVAFASLGTPANGSFAYCNDCAPTTPASCPGTKASCICTNGGVGSWALRTNSLWYCPF